MYRAGTHPPQTGLDVLSSCKSRKGERTSSPLWKGSAWTQHCEPACATWEFIVSVGTNGGLIPFQALVTKMKCADGFYLFLWMIMGWNLPAVAVVLGSGIIHDFLPDVVSWDRLEKWIIT